MINLYTSLALVALASARSRLVVPELMKQVCFDGDYISRSFDEIRLLQRESQRHHAFPLRLHHLCASPPTTTREVFKFLPAMDITVLEELLKNHQASHNLHKAVLGLFKQGFFDSGILTVFVRDRRRFEMRSVLRRVCRRTKDSLNKALLELEDMDDESSRKVKGIKTICSQSEQEKLMGYHSSIFHTFSDLPSILRFHDALGFPSIQKVTTEYTDSFEDVLTHSFEGILLNVPGAVLAKHAHQWLDQGTLTKDIV